MGRFLPPHEEAIAFNEAGATRPRKLRAYYCARTTAPTLQRDPAGVAPSESFTSIVFVGEVVLFNHTKS